MAYGLCDVSQCKEPTILGWRPLTERIGRQICETHWNEHKAGTFSLYDAFGFNRPPKMAKIVKMKEHCACGEELQPGHRLCDNCAAERERERKREYYHRSKEETPPKVIFLQCAICENEREPNHRYCSLCAKQRRRKLDRERKKELRRIKNG